MPSKSSEANGVSNSSVQVKSWGKDDGDCPGAVDILAVWIAEDVMAFAKSLGVDPAGVLKEAVERIQSESLLDQGDSDFDESGKYGDGDRLGR